MSDVAVDVVELVKVYGKQRAVDGLTLSVPRGAIFGLLGPNGAGKSTTFGIVCGWLRPTGGTSKVLGVPSPRLHELRGRVSALPQDARFPDAVTVIEQLRHFGRLQGLTAAAADAEAQRALAAVDLVEATKKRGDQLSHGMAKRVGIAQALIGRPDVVFLDEPTAGLDPHNARRLRDLIASLAPSTTVIVSSHNLAEIQDICTHGAIIDRGKLVASGTMAQLTRRGEEILFKVRPGFVVQLGPLRERFGAANVAATADCVSISHTDAGDGATVIAAAMRIFIETETPVLGIERGTSLETAFLELTRPGSP